MMHLKRPLVTAGILTLLITSTACEEYKHCPEGQSWCWAECVDLTKDDNNCGWCDNQCDPHSDCVEGRCECNPGYTNCDGQCVNLDYDANNCGACGNSCSNGEPCYDGACGIVDGCEDFGLANCGNVCVDLSTDESHCGACFNACRNDQECIEGRCVNACVCHVNSDCRPGYCCDSCMCFPKGCEGKCCGEDRCGGTCPDECAEGKTCVVSSCTCEDYGDENDPCPYGIINPDEPECGPGRICLALTDGECPSGTNYECRDNWGNPFCVDGYCKYSMCYLECDLDFDEYPCGCPTGYEMNEFEYEQELVCVCWDEEQSGTQVAGGPCPFGNVNTSYDFCGKYDECNGMVCLGNDSTDGTCPEGAATECTEIPESHNPDCVNGICGFSFCSPPCIDGACDDGFEPVDVYEMCYCIPLP